MHHRRSLRLLAIGAIVAFMVALAGSPAQSAVAPSRSTSATKPASTAPHARTEALSKWHCGKWSGNGGIGWRYCANFSVFDEQFDTDYTRSVFNKFRHQTLTFQCKTSKSTTWRFYAEGTVKAQAGVIFAKAEASATAGVEHSVTTTDEVSSSFKVRPRHWANCKRGAYKYKFRGLVRKQTCDSSGCVYSGMQSFTGQAPSRDAFMIGPGRG